MVGDKRLLTVILVWFFLNETKETSSSSKSVNKSGTILPPDYELIENGTTFGCSSCDSNPQCGAFRCPQGYAYVYSTSSCFEDNVTPWARGIEGLVENHHVTKMSHYCGSGYRSFIRRSKVLRDPRDWSVCVEKSEKILDSAEYCLYREPNTTDYWTLQCELVLAEVLIAMWTATCLGLATLVALATFVVYIVVPELKNRPGLIVRGYIAAYSGYLIFWTTLFTLEVVWPGFDVVIDGPLLALTCYFLLACFFWLNVMSFDIWRNFREYRSREEVGAERRERPRIVCYSLYAWGTPIIVFLVWFTQIELILSYVETSRYLFTLPFFGVFILNTYLYISTALRIKKMKKETAKMVDGVNRHHQKNELWLNIYVKLFFIMGCLTILWIPILDWPEKRIITIPCLTAELLQAFCVFYVLVWKDDVKRSFHKQFAKMINGLGFCRRSDSTTVIENENEDL